MFKRRLLQELDLWLKKPDRKPMVIRGARQVGKTFQLLNLPYYLVSQLHPYLNWLGATHQGK